MPTIHLNTNINAPIQTCFDLARSIDLHLDTMQHTNEQAVAGVTGGLISPGETVTWRARHFGVSLQMSIKITEMMPVTSFTGEQIKGPFKKLKHRHIFQYIKPEQTLMIDEFEFASPLGILGRLADTLVLKKYLTDLLINRNKIIKNKAENFHENLT
ncbi:SRPBCC family protein [Mucilaginibacter myungsuensis]|uniref:SRPBCC family protein n=1 Tax=Mucilaginibacter myungsuensis TaxID=649104 RepID=A0A929PZR5_9SPHI|nr:SRPBCC family protein [Mucilaginibacter myungsuensis]MBE9664702.1 SRPBCC family protein [Mucilaginibacter myungsuensis]MDN3601441.1 SRPBCC family protein [Mucilaginibacter myungsuensis]